MCIYIYMGVDQNISACERYNRRSTANQSQPQRWQSRRDFVLSNVMCIENKIDISIDIEIYTSHKPVQRSILWFIVRGAGRTCRGAWSIASCGQILHVLPLFPAPQKSVGLFSCSAGPSIFQIGCCHAPAGQRVICAHWKRVICAHCKRVIRAQRNRVIRAQRAVIRAHWAAGN